MSVLRNGLQSADLDIPVVLPTLNLDFANSQQLDPRITFTRGSIGTFVNKNGLIETAAANIPRFDYDPISGECRGLLIEETRTNYWQGTLTGSGGTVSNGTATGADGVTAKKFVPTLGSTAYPGIYNSTQYSIPVDSQVAGRTVDISFSGYFASVADGLYVPDIVVAISSSGTNYIYAELLPNLSNGGIVSKALNTGVGWSELISPQITLMPFGMYKVTWSVRYTQGATIRNLVDFGIQCRRKNSPSDATGTYYADGVNGFQFSCVQYEVGAFPTSYIPTSGSTVTRSADLADMRGSNFSSWYNQNEGTIYVNNRVPYTPNPNVSLYFIIFGINAGNRHSVEQTTANGLIYITQNSGGVQYWSTSGSGILPANTNRKTTYAYGSSNNKTLLSGTSNQTYTFNVKSSVDVYKSMTTMHIGRFNDSLYFLNGTISRLTYYPRRLKDFQLSLLTQ